MWGTIVLSRLQSPLVAVEMRLSAWAGKFDERFTDIFDVEDSISDR
jgi:TolB-like protein